jgi:2-haloacid dehalogenase
MTLQAVLFDAYGTLFDVHSVAACAEQCFPGQGAALSQRWRERQIDYTRLVSMGGRYRPFWTLTLAALRHAAQGLGLALDAAVEASLMDTYRELGAHADSLAVLQALQQRGMPAGILSNGDPEMLAAAVRSAGFGPLLQHVISVDAVQRYKPDPATYALGTAALGLPAQAVLFVSSNSWDAIGATWYGYTALWVDRGAGPLEQLDTEPAHRGRSLLDVLALLPPAPASRSS